MRVHLGSVVKVLHSLECDQIHSMIAVRQIIGCSGVPPTLRVPTNPDLSTQSNAVLCRAHSALQVGQS